MFLSINNCLILSFILFFLGLSILLIKQNLMFIFIGLEVMINSILLSMIAISHYWNQLDGQILYILIITVAASEVGIGLILLVKVYQNYKTLNIYILSEISQ
ncbi:NADH dehydrogenase I chain K [Buchnera aphidicola (Cinara tujafilina)]|uniref:NADH-quinone oxidoreductase subunit K n=1 Tax=Buchnera aphidicola (Cinara tujafilina) TaxID=261317 RepID=F7WZ49_9GAMM|nr:NADH-quinone oxidoreductase subunit NuoK [Buchnera aphidicola]AEH39701.1 NADH dehydrogenase I chain K [Buchnera aphidicola (Cinara tujafilina)]